MLLRRSGAAMLSPGAVRTCSPRGVPRWRDRVSSMPAACPWKTHEVFNQAPPLEGVDVFSTNLPLVEALQREGGGWARERAAALGAVRGRRCRSSTGGRLANENKPVLRTHDRYGNRIDEVEFHPAWHNLMRMGVENELHSLPWTTSSRRRTWPARVST